MGPQSDFVHKLLSILAVLVITSFTSFVVEGEPQGVTCPIQSIYQLGDSISDTGNLLRYMPGNPASRLPYGTTFPGHPTGRWSDGRLIIDYIAMNLGLPLLNPHTDQHASFEHGVNFAVSGSTTLGPAFYITRGILTRPVPSLRTQFRQFKRHLETMCLTPEDCQRKLNHSLVFVGEIGFNDIAYAYGQGRTIAFIRSYQPLVNQVIINTTREVILAGARQVIVPGLFPLGCFPLALANAFKHVVKTYDDMGCLKDLNELIASRNNDLERDVDDLRQEFPQANILYVDLYNDFLSLLRRAPELGFDKSSLMEACCGADATFNSAGPQFCGNSIFAPVCPNPNNHIHWDGIHLTQEAYRHLANKIIQDLNISCPK